MTEKEYRSHPAISRSELWRINESPEKFRYYKDHPTPPTAALLFGQVTHKLALLPDDFDSDFAIMPEVDRRTKEGKATYAVLTSIAEENGIQLVSQTDYDKAAEMIEVLRNNPVAQKYLDGSKEVPFFWTDPDTGEQCKCRLDCLSSPDGALTVVDYKTATNASTDAFNRDIYKYGYHFQAAMYTEGVMRAAELPERPGFTFVVQEKNPPYAVNVITIPNDVMLAGIDKYRELMGIYHDCNETGVWWGYNGLFDEPNEAYLPGYMSLGVEGEDE